MGQKNESPQVVETGGLEVNAARLHEHLTSLALSWPRPGDAAKRPPPAFQEYGHSLLANEEIRAMGLNERGLLWTMRLECWANGTLPAEPARLAAMLHVAPAEIEASLTPSVMTFFRHCKDYPDRLYCPELAAYMLRQLDRWRAAQESGSRGGKLSAKKRRESAEA